MYVKICGITRRADALAAAEAGADFVGLICAESPRRVALATAREIAANLPPAVQPVLVFRDTPLEEVCGALDETEFRWVQLHGTEKAAYVRELLHRFPETSVIRAWEVAGPGAAEELGEYLRAAARGGVRFDVVLLDAPKGQPHPGYDCLGEVSRRCQELAGEFWCAGGLTADNVAAAVVGGVYAGVDTARGVEASPGIKDAAAVRRFVALARSL